MLLVALTEVLRIEFEQAAREVQSMNVVARARELQESSTAALDPEREANELVTLQLSLAAARSELGL
jgi:hypothetical protein